jgi:hypothetical protein
MTTGNDAGGRGSVTETDALQAALAAAGTGTWHWSVATGLVHWDATLEALCGMVPGEFGATYEAWLESLHPDERGSNVVARLSPTPTETLREPSAVPSTSRLGRSPSSN